MKADIGLIKPQQSRSTEKLNRILESTELLLRAKTYDELTVTDIVNEAGVSIGTFYNRFRSKEALMALMLEAYWTRTNAQLEVCLEAMASETSARVRLQHMIEYYVDDYSQNAGILRSIVLRWRMTFSSVTGQDEHADTIRTVNQLARSIQGQDDVAHDDAVYCVHIAANLCRDFCLFPELLATPTVANWETTIRSQLLRACEGLINKA